MPCCSPMLLQYQLCSNRSISPMRRAHNSKLAACCCSGQVGQTDGQIDRPLYCYIDPDLHTMRAVSITKKNIKILAITGLLINGIHCDLQYHHCHVNHSLYINCQQKLTLLKALRQYTESIIHKEVTSQTRNSYQEAHLTAGRVHSL